MITKDYLEKKGFKPDHTSPDSVRDYEMHIRPQGGYVSVRFRKDEETPCGLYAYSEGHDHSNTRKVVLNDTLVTEQDLEMAMTICRF